MNAIISSKRLRLTKEEPRKAGRTSAFTLVELLAVMGVATVLALVLTPALARTKPGSQSLRCFNNTRQLINAWQLYHTDNNGKLVNILHGGQAQTPDPKWRPWCLGWESWDTSTANTNTLLLVGDANPQPQYNPGLAKYLAKTAAVFKCPADTYLSPNQKRMGWLCRARSYSANVGIGDGNAEEGPWNMAYRHIKTATDFLYPAPAETWVFTEEHPDSMNDPAFFNPQAATLWTDSPAAHHNGACGFAFADGHSEFHKWTGSLVVSQIKTVRFMDLMGFSAPSGDPDIHWMSYHAGRNTAASY